MMGISINMNKAKEITKQRLRYDRAPLLQELDVKYQRAIEANGDTTSIVAEKQRLRDITKLVDRVNTPEELKNIKCN